jgi:di/tricarboxylate transporter
MEFTVPMAICVLLTLGAVLLFVWEKIPADVTALTILCLLLLTGVLAPRDAFVVFSNEAPLTVAAMFVLSAALLKTGGMDMLAGLLGRTAGRSEFRSLVVIFAIAGASSAFINNTPVVAVLMPVILRHARNTGIPASQLLMPLSFAAVMGGSCTLIGTSTNLVVHGMAQSRGLPGFTMFELAWIGVPLLLAGALYTILFAPRLLPRRETLTTLLPPEERKPQMLQVIIPRESPLIGRKLVETEWLADTGAAGVRILEMRRSGARLVDDLREVTFRELDRLTLAVGSKAVRQEGAALHLNIRGLDERALGVEILTPVEGRIVEAVVAPNSEWAGYTLREIRPRTLLGIQVLAVHRNGRNLTREFADSELHPGDTLLLLGATPAIEEASSGDRNLILLEEHQEPPMAAHPAPWAGWAAWGSVAAVVAAATLGLLPISVAALGACALLLLLGVIEPKEAYRSIDWQILMIICGTMGLGIALEQTGTARWMAEQASGLLAQALEPRWLPLAMLVFFIVGTSVFTEFASNNGAAALMVPLAIEVARHLDVSPLPFLIAVTVSASAAFATPIGYQTNTMVYGAGGYTFRDFLRMGIPLNLICWVLQILIIPRIWEF